ncbi:transglutaminase domain-containing protein [Candidatus Woesearchaeota archaeon]|nr:transglutaminase domain-containing protein [Candidatus Woesearchaeota archaeon]
MIRSNAANCVFTMYYPSLTDFSGHGTNSFRQTIHRSEYLASIRRGRPLDARTFSERDPESLLGGYRGIKSLAGSLPEHLGASDAHKLTSLVLEILARIPMDTAPNKGYGKSSLETLIENNGDQSDIAMLGVALLHAGGVDSAVFDFDGYAVIGVAVSGDFLRGVKSRSPDSIVTLGGKSYLMIDMPHKLNKNYFTQERSIIPVNREAFAVQVDDILDHAYNPEGRTATSMVKPGCRLVYFPPHNETPMEVHEHPNLFLKYMQNLAPHGDFGLVKFLKSIFGRADRDDKVSKPVSFFYAVPQKDYLEASAIPRNQSSLLLANGEHMNLVDYLDTSIGTVTGHIISSFYPSRHFQEIPEIERAQLILDAVHRLPYIKDPVLDYPKHPAETLAEFGGDCEDLAILAASMMRHAKLDCALLDFEGHVAAGVYIPEGQLPKLKGTVHVTSNRSEIKYFFCECTGTDWPDNPSRGRVGQANVDYISGRKKLEGLLVIS